MTTTITSASFLDIGLDMLERGENVAETMAGIHFVLNSMRSYVSENAWKQFAAEECRHHPLMQLMQQDPLTARAFTKPRGYAGDAVMMDLLYAAEDCYDLPELEGISELGRQIYEYQLQTPTAKAVRARRHIISEKVDDLARRTSGAHILSLACGHLREANECPALLEGRIGRYLAIDQDKESLAVVEREVGTLGVETLAASVRDVLKGNIHLTGFDMVYATGLYDYLLEPVAQHLCEMFFDMLNPGGRFLIANFLPGISNVGYMETFMDWWLIYRTKEELLRLAETLPEKQVEAIDLFVEENKNIVFLEVSRKG
jgi:extracellular factor (EF) 3-hydroxypalmitic acid methyl ester biosynthesis protein